MKKILLFFAALCLLGTVQTKADDAACDFVIDGLLYNIDSENPDAVVLVGHAETLPLVEGKLTIPASIQPDTKEYAVTGIGTEALSYCDDITSVVIPSSVTSIGEGAFFECTGLTSIDFPSSVTSIGKVAFADCSGLDSLSIPASLTSIGVAAFGGCSGLTSIRVDEENPAYDSRFGCQALIETATNTLLQGCVNTTIPSSVTGIAAMAFADFAGLTSIDIPSSVASIGQGAFMRSGLTSIDISSSVTSIGEVAFEGCSGLTSIDIPNSVTSIGQGVFSECTALKTAKISRQVVGNVENAFNGCTSLTDLYVRWTSDIPVHNEVGYADMSFLEVKLGSATLHVHVGTKAVYEADPIWSKFGTIVEYISFADSQTRDICCDSWDSDKDGEIDLNEAGKITSLSPLDGFERSGITSFDEMKYFTNLTSIKGTTFDICLNLTSVSLPASITSLGASAFYACSNLSDVTVFWDDDASIPSIDADVFHGLTLSEITLHVPVGTVSLYKSKEVWKDFRIEEMHNVVVSRSDGSLDQVMATGATNLVIDEDNMSSLLVTTDVEEVKSISYRRDFGTAVDVWQCWFAPFEMTAQEMSGKHCEVAEIAGILMNEKNETVIAFKKLGEDATMLANTPYVVRYCPEQEDASTDICFEAGEIGLKATAASAFTVQSAYDNFTFTGNYEAQHIDGAYTLNTKGEFQKMGTSVNLRPMRFALTIEKRSDSPYPTSAGNVDKVMLHILGENELTGIGHVCREVSDDVMYDLNGRPVKEIRSGEFYILNGRKYLAR